MKRLIFRLHELLGLIVGGILIIIGVTGALLCFREEILDALNPNVRVVSVRSGDRLVPPDLVKNLQQQLPRSVIVRLELSSRMNRSVRVSAMHWSESSYVSQAIYVDPYTGALLGEAHGDGFFAWVEHLHRFLLLPRGIGRTIVGGFVCCLLLLMISGLILRWPDNIKSIRRWLAFDPRLRGRPLWWSLHTVLATWAIPIWLLLALSGIYWAFDGIRGHVDGLAGIHYVPHSMRPVRYPPKQTPDITAAWKTFARHAGSWSWVRIDLSSSPRFINILWLPPGARHERQRNSMQINLDGSLTKVVSFASLPVGRRALAAIYPLHMGTYFGLPGRILWALAGLILVFASISGAWLYWCRFVKVQRISRNFRKMEGDGGSGKPILVAYASQTGHAEEVAWRTAKYLKSAGRRVRVCSLEYLTLQELSNYFECIFIASTYGEGEPPDMAKHFAHLLLESKIRFRNMRYTVLALGNQRYATYCAFGIFLHQRLALLDATPRMAVQCACDTDAKAKKRWLTSLAIYGVSIKESEEEENSDQDAWQSFLLTGRACLNPASLEGPIHEIKLLPSSTSDLPYWTPGDWVEIMPRHPDARILNWCQNHQLNPDASLHVHSSVWRLADWLAGRELPENFMLHHAPEDCLKFSPLQPRRYSIASIPADGYIRLLVRRHMDAGVPGVASGWLTETCRLNGIIQLRIIENTRFSVNVGRVPCLFVGAGSGLAGLLGLLRERVRVGRGENWLVFGERQKASDTLCEEELGIFTKAGLLSLDRVYSRDAGSPTYVQDCLTDQAERLLTLVRQGGCIYVCGSFKGMGQAVDARLRQILGDTCLESMAQQGRYCRDVY